MAKRSIGSRSGSTSRSSSRRVAPRANRRLGQHFLSDENILRRIVDAADLRPEESVVEVGPGRGALTAVIAEGARRVIAVEVDRDLIPSLNARFASSAAVFIIRGDVLAHTPQDLLAAGGAAQPYAVIANLPYNIAAAVIRHFLESARQPRTMVVMVQREVADAIVAKPGAMSLLSVGVQTYGDARTVMRVPPGAFHPRPRVDSAVVRIDVAPRPNVDVPIADLFVVARAGFSQPRKQLRNSLASGLSLDAGAIEALLRRVSVDPSRRPQTLSVQEWERVARAWRAWEAA